MQHNSPWFISDDKNLSTIFFYKIQTILVDYLKENLTILDKIFYFSDSCTGQYKNRKNLLICVIISKISVWMLNGYSLQLVMASHHAMVLGDLLNVTLKNVVYKDPYVTKVLSYQSMHDLCVRKIPSITFFSVSQEEMVNVPTDLEDYFAKTKTMLGTRSSHHSVSVSCNKLLTNLQVRIESFFNLISTNH